MPDGHSTLEWYHLLDGEKHLVHNAIATMNPRQAAFVNQVAFMVRLGWHWEPCKKPIDHVEYPADTTANSHIDSFICLPPCDRPNAD